MIVYRQPPVSRHQAVSPAKTGATILAHRNPSHRQMGNQAVQRLLRDGVIQAKLTVSQPGDRFEQEADRVADTVMRMPDRASESVQGAARPPLVQRACAKCEEELHRKAGPGPKQVGESFRHPSSGGRPLPDSERRFFEPRLSHDFSNVRIYSDAQAAGAVRSVNALAYTKENDVVFGQRQYQPGTQSGRSLLAHELVHVIQQSRGGRDSKGQSAISRMSGQAPFIQRMGDPSQAPPGMSCPIATTSSADPVATNVLFPISASSLSAAAIADIDNFVGRWNAAGTNPAVRVDGFASTDGPQSTNWTLSCNRASAVARELETPSSGASGIPNQFINVLAQGETSEFGSALEANRRATISANLAVPPVPETITSQTVATTPGVRTRTTVGVGEEVTLTHTPGAAAWATTAGSV